MYRVGVSDGQGGGVLLMVLVISVLVCGLVTAAAYETSLALRSHRDRRDASIAHTQARSALEAGARLAAETADWRNNLPTGVWLNDRALGLGRITVSAEDPEDGLIAVDGKLTSSSADTVRLSAVARRGDVARRLRMDCVPTVDAALRYAVFAIQDVTLTLTRIEGRLRAGGDVTDQGAGDVHGDIHVQTTSTVSPTLDDADTTVETFTDPPIWPVVDFEWFRAAGEEVVIPVSRVLSNGSLSSVSNPYGAVSARAIYWMDAAGSNVTIESFAIEACVAVINAGEVQVKNALGSSGLENQTPYYHHSPDPDRLPALVVQGDLRMSVQGATAIDLVSVDGTEPVTSSLEGVFYCTGRFRGPQLDASGELLLTGAVVAATAELVGWDLTVRHDPRLNLTPIAELTGSGLRVVPDSVREL